MTPAPIDARAFEGLQAQAGADFVLTLVDAFVEEAPQLLLALRQAAAQGDDARFEDAAHSLKSNAAAFGATRLAELARRLEWQRPGNADGRLDALAAALATTLPALQALARA